MRWLVDSSRSLHHLVHRFLFIKMTFSCYHFLASFHECRLWLVLIWPCFARLDDFQLILQLKKGLSLWFSCLRFCATYQFLSQIHLNPFGIQKGFFIVFGSKVTFKVQHTTSGVVWSMRDFYLSSSSSSSSSWYCVWIFSKKVSMILLSLFKIVTFSKLWYKVLPLFFFAGYYRH